jgi:hypothetical protein
MTEHPYQPGTVWVPRRGKAAPRRVVDLWYDYQAGRRCVIYAGTTTRESFSVTLDTFRRWAGEQIK